MHPLHAELSNVVRAYASSSPLSRLRDLNGAPMWEEPLVGIADGDDPHFQRCREVVGPAHWAPRQALAKLASLPKDPDAPRHVSVVSWILPIAEPAEQSNRRIAEGPCLSWQQTRFEGEAFNESLRRYVVGWPEEVSQPWRQPSTPGYRGTTP